MERWRAPRAALAILLVALLCPSIAGADEYVPDTPHRPIPGAVPPLNDLGDPPTGTNAPSAQPSPAKPSGSKTDASRRFPTATPPAPVAPGGPPPQQQADLDRQTVRYLENQLVDVIGHVARKSVTLISRSRGVGTSATQPITGAGSGVVVNYHGVHILTNAHVVDTDDSMMGILYDGSEHRLTVRATDKNLDIALLRFAGGEPKALWAANLSEYPNTTTSEGTWVIATGNPFLLCEEGRAAASVGVISGFRRNSKPPHGKLIQHDAEINPGSSGGPLWNAQGRLVGLNGAILTRARVIGSGGPSFTGASVAIPINEIRSFIERATGNAPIRTRPVVHSRPLPIASLPHPNATAPRPPAVVGTLKSSSDIGAPPPRLLHGEPSIAYMGEPVPDEQPIGLDMEDRLNRQGAAVGVLVSRVHSNSVFHSGPGAIRLSSRDVIVGLTASGQYYAVESIAHLISVLDLHGAAKIEAVEVIRQGTKQYLLPSP